MLRKADPDDDNVFEDIRAFRTPNTVTIAPTVHHDQNGHGNFPLFLVLCSFSVLDNITEYFLGGLHRPIQREKSGNEREEQQMLGRRIENIEQFVGFKILNEMRF